MHTSCTIVDQHDTVTNFTIKKKKKKKKPYLTSNINVCYTPPVISGPIPLIKLNTHKKKKKKKKKNVVGTWASFSIAN